MDLYPRRQSPNPIALCYRKSTRGTRSAKKCANHLGTSLNLGADISKKLSGKANCPTLRGLGKSQPFQLVEGKGQGSCGRLSLVQYLLPGEVRSQRTHCPGKAERSPRVISNNSATCTRWKRKVEEHGDQLSFISLNSTVCVGKSQCLMLQMFSFSL